MTLIKFLKTEEYKFILNLMLIKYACFNERNFLLCQNNDRVVGMP
ncbi:MAG: hypothetical protein JWP78_3025 [Mucilaginibacter sp.]|nr:hypothetical protein [Mucilaginibacter sp.]